MLVKNIFSLITLAVLATFTANAEMLKKRDEDPDRNPTNYALFDPYDDPIPPRVECTLAVVNIRT